MKEFDEVCKMK